jgi:hypothetical protein
MRDQPGVDARGEFLSRPSALEEAAALVKFCNCEDPVHYRLGDRPIILCSGDTLEELLAGSRVGETIGKTCGASALEEP